MDFPASGLGAALVKHGAHVLVGAEAEGVVAATDGFEEVHVMGCSHIRSRADRASKAREWHALPRLWVSPQPTPSGGTEMFVPDADRTWRVASISRSTCPAPTVFGSPAPSPP